jgi:hypothetical protein
MMVVDSAEMMAADSAVMMAASKVVQLALQWAGAMVALLVLTTAVQLVSRSVDLKAVMSVEPLVASMVVQ